jgi:regulator of protease activity HflC (stomatin/prohibitin superfamily)
MRLGSLAGSCPQGQTHRTNYACESGPVRMYLQIARANYTRTVLAAMAEANATITRAKAQAAQITLIADATRTAIEMLIKAAGANATEAARLAELYIYLRGLRDVAQTGNVQILAISGGAGQVVPIVPIAR